MLNNFPYNQQFFLILNNFFMIKKFPYNQQVSFNLVNKEYVI